ncbi:MAG: hypothetical protein AAFO77_09135, partial [Pseudomonadota bacterium]
MKKLLLTTALSLLAGTAMAKDPSYIGSVEVIRGSGDGADTARGTVFRDANRNSRLDAGEEG